ncbi:hypothetical protein BY996DRAFT_4573081 [Phakopsora pachyrhizi]|uniref:non-specific serine/threonine protein kinase n=1 Tax=Phakopsora pachyrhizi TaxID=170000 RepID=A0AAV0ATS1_PHAPC|nr:hypothetical protein BY996DRAFT_4573081 [Phakopsora pachyrhizi]CAH7672212.1 expressed protein [Phakopsora pachyrhizi]
MLLNAENSPIARRVRGRMSLVTSSARRRRIQQRPINETTQPVKPLANSPLATLSAPHITPIKTFNSQKNIKAGRLAVASPLCRRQPVLSPYITIPPNRGIESLLKTCNQDSVLDFSTSIKNLCSKFRPETGLIGNWIKVGEASYSEVYCWSSPKVSRNSSVKMNEQIVMKVIPIRRPGRQAKHISTTTIDHSDDSRKSDPNESPAETDWADAEKEVKLTKLLGSSSSIEGFIDFRGCLVVSGAYPKVLLKEWDKYKRRFPQQSYNPRPSKFHIKQLYCCILLRNSGTDLESFEVLDWQQAASIFSQVINTLSQGERKYRFEHRDLHWGNILVEPVESSKLNHNQTVSSSKRAEKHIEGIAKLLFETKLDSPLNPLDPSSSGVSVSIIDYGLSRANLPSSLNISKKGRDAQKAEQVVWTKPDSDIFGGSSTNSDYQFMCYDLMNISMKNKPWSEFNPTTNFIWLHYVVKKLIEEKGLSAPPSLTKSQNNDRPICSQAQQNLSERVTREKSTIESKCYKLLVESEKALGSLIQIKVPSLASSKPTTRSNLGRKIDSRGFLDEFCGIDGSDELSASMFLNWWNLQQNETFQN